MHYIHTSIVSRHLAIRGNNKILRTPPPHISSYEEILPISLVAPLPNSEQINLPSSIHTYTKSMTNHIHHHYAPSAAPTHMTHSISSTAPTYAPHCHLVDHKRDDRTPPPHKQESREWVDTTTTKSNPI